MTTYRTTSWQAAPGQTLSGAGPNGDPVFLTLLGILEGFDPSALEALRLPQPADSPLLAPLIDLGTSGGSLFAVEPRVRAWPLSAILERARLEGAALAPDACAWVAARLCEAVASLGASGHRGLSLRTVLLQASGEPYVLGGAWAHLLGAGPDGGPASAPESQAGQRRSERRADASAIAELARQLATCGSAQPDDWGSLPVSLKAPLLHATEGRSSAAALGQQLVSALESWGRAPSARTVAAWLERLGLSEAAPMEASSPAQELEPAGPFATGFGGGGPALARDGQLDRPARFLQIEPLAVQTVAAPAAARPAPGEQLELDEAALAHAFGPASAQPEPQPRAPRRRRRVAAALAGTASIAALLAGLWALGVPGAIREAVESALPRERPKGSYGTAMLRIESSPPGAELRLGEELLGQTPYVGDNDYPAGAHRVRLSLPGYETAQIEFEGARDASLSVRLRPRR